MYAHMYVQEPHKDESQKGSQAIQAYIPSWAKERDRALGFQRGRKPLTGR